MKIEKNIPITKTHKSKYPFDNMEIGDSFFVEKKNGKSTLQGSVSTLAKRWVESYKPEAKFTTRKQDNGFRIWRIK